MADPQPAEASTSNGSRDVFVAAYHDTPDRRLARAHITLSRRLRDGAGLWEARIGQEVVAAPGGPASLPEELAERLTALLRNRELVEIVRLRTGTDDVALLEGQHVVRTYGDLGTALGETVAAPSEQGPRRRAPAIEHVRAYLRRQLAEIERTDPLIRSGDDPEAVHDFRVAVRRTRSVLRTTAELFDEDWLATLRGELRWLGGELGPLRDLDVLLEGIRGDVTPEQASVVRLLETERRRARGRALKALSGERYLRVLDRLGAAVDAPPVRASELSLEAVAAREFGKLRRAGRRLSGTPSDADVHAARIRAKRARYAAEIVAPSMGAKARRFIAEAKRFQEVVGAHQDAVSAAERIHGLLVRTKSLETAFAAGRLAERVAGRRATARQKLPVAWKRLENQGRKTWG